MQTTTYDTAATDAPTDTQVVTFVAPRLGIATERSRYVNLRHGRSKGLTDDETRRRVIACRLTGIPADAAHIAVLHVQEVAR